MSSLRTHNDTWDIKSSVGTTAVMVAYTFQLLLITKQKNILKD